MLVQYKNASYLFFRFITYFFMLKKNLKKFKKKSATGDFRFLGSVGKGQYKLFFWPYRQVRETRYCIIKVSPKKEAMESEIRSLDMKGL